ncbi:hypothetical protein L195_g025797 [Trifolium pratense]|uniref:Uncharacterized protein n=1 Tax=Trifolium pratense TaxID=57577 RepID=A0A2K3NHI6_TRIPR|nr:hypothetical protein L195_g025797 [Trifolium pratense]
MSNVRTSKPVGMLQLDKETTYHKEIDLLKRKLEKATLGAEVKKVHEICDFCHKNHPNGYCVPEGISDEEYTKFMGRPSPYSGWVDKATKEACKAVGERTETTEDKRKKDEKELRQLQKWFKQLGLTLEETYDEFMEELDEYYEETLVQGRALCDLGSSINLMPLKFAKKWEIGELDTNYAKDIVLADQLVIRPIGIMKDVLVKVKNHRFSKMFQVNIII